MTTSSADRPDDLNDRHSAYFLALAEGAPSTGALEQELDNLRAALTWSLDREPGRALALAAALEPLWRRRRLLSEGRSWLRRALAAAPASPDDVRARALTAAADLARLQGDNGDAVELARDATAAAAGPEAAATAWRSLGEAHLARGETGAAREALQRAMGTATAEDGRIEVAARTAIARAWLADGDGTATLAAVEEATARARASGDAEVLASHLLARAEVLFLLERYDAAEAACQECADVRRSAGDPDGEVSVALRLAGRVADSRGDRRTAQARYAEAEREARAAERWSVAAAALKGLADVDLYERRYDEARVRYEEAASMLRSLDDPTAEELKLLCGILDFAAMIEDEHGDAQARLGVLADSVAVAARIGGVHFDIARSSLARAHEQMGSNAAAVELLDAVLATPPATDEPDLLAWREHLRLRRCFAVGDIPGAVEAAERRLELARRAGYPQAEASGAAELASVLLALPDLDRAKVAADTAVEVAARSHVWVRGYASRVASAVHARRGDVAAAAVHIVSCLRERPDQGETVLPSVLEAAARCDLLEGRPEVAAAAMAAAAWRRAKSSQCIWPSHQGLIDDVHAAGIAAVGEARWSELLAVPVDFDAQIEGAIDRFASLVD